MADQKFASFAPEDVKDTSGSNLWDNVDAVITGFKFTKEMPDNYRIEAKPGEEIAPIGVQIDFLVDGTAPEDERRVNQFFSVGAKTGLSFDIAADGFSLIAKNDEATIYKSNFTKFVASLVENGLPLTVAQSGHFKPLVGLKGHFKRIEDKTGRERTWKDKKGVEHKELPKVLLCTKVHALTSGAAGAASTTSSAPAGADAFDLDTAASDALLATLTAKKKPLQRSQLVLLVSQQVAKDPNRAAIAKRAAEEEFLTLLADAGMITYDAAGKGQPVALPAAT